MDTTTLTDHAFKKQWCRAVWGPLWVRQGHCIQSLCSTVTDSNFAAARFHAGIHISKPYAAGVTQLPRHLSRGAHPGWGQRVANQMASQGHSAHPSRVCEQELPNPPNTQVGARSETGIHLQEPTQFLVMNVPILRKIHLFMWLVKKVRSSSQLWPKQKAFAQVSSSVQVRFAPGCSR